MNEVFSIISKTPLFKGLSEENLASVAKISIEKKYKKMELIFSDGDDGNGFYIVIDGKVKIYKLSTEGKEHILHIFGPGHPFGEVPVFAGQHFPANAQTIAESRLIFIPRAKFVELITASPSLAMNMLAVLSMRLREFTVQIENLSLKEVPGRLASYLIELVAEQDARGDVELNISKRQLASLLGTIPETLSRIFSRMMDDNMIAVNGRSIRIVDYPALSALAEYGKYQE